MIAKAPRGTKDVLPYESYKWHYVEDNIREITRLFGYKEIRTPTFEHTELFERGVGETTDVVQKEMYTFDDKGGRSITLKPEGTAGAVRAYIEGGLHSMAQPIKMYYLTPVFRYEKPQTGRLREHHQFGIEVFGAPEASVDAERL
jgi:histidyl-tRNA synthetase